MAAVLWVVVLIGGITSCAHGQQGLPFQVNYRQTCATQTSIDTTTLTGVKRGDENAPCSGYLMYTDGGRKRRLCSDGNYGFSDYAAERACYTLGVNFYRDTTVFAPSHTRQMKLYQCFNYKEQGVDSIETDQNMEVWDTSYIFNDWIETVCLDEQANPDAYDCFDTCYFTSPDYGKPHATTEAHCGDHQPFTTLGCADINECENGVQDHCTGPYESSCTIRKACGNNTDCTNHPGSFECSCKNGYKYRSGSSFDPYDLDEGCKDVDECSESKCDVHAKCVNTVGSYLCWCKDGFTGNGKTCTHITCNDPPTLPNAKYKLPVASASSYSFGDTAVCECDEGYKVSVLNLPENLVNYYGYTTTDFFTLTCDENGEWGPYLIPQCIPVECEDPGLPLHAERHETGFMYKQEVTYRCEGGYKPQMYQSSDTFTRRCQADGTWTEGTYCVDVNECEVSNTCKDEQHCINTKGSFLCLDGSPDNCDVDGFCKNGACEVRKGWAECVCDAGYVGLRCDTRITSAALILSIIAIVMLGFLILMYLVSCCIRCPRSQPLGPPHAVISPAINRGPFPTKIAGYGCPAVRW